MKRRIRCFLAIEVPEPIRKRLAREIGFLQLAGARVAWVREKNLHMTVTFLGDVDVIEIPDICKSIEGVTAAAPRFRLDVGGVIGIPRGGEPRTIAAGVGGDTEALAALVQNLGAGLRPHGFRSGRTAFTPHVTLGRLKDGATADLQERLAAGAARKFGSMTVSEIHLMMSDRSRDGSEYASMNSFDLV